MSRIVDPNLRLTLLQAAWDENLVSRFDKEAFFRDELHQELDDEADYNNRIDTRVRDALLAIPLPDETLAQIRLVEWDGGNRIWREIWTNWDGESGEFDVKSLSGIEACTGLESLLFIAGGRFKNIAPLARLPSLAEFKDYSDSIDDLRPLLTIPKLATLDVRYAPTTENRAALSALKLRGVSVVEHG